MFEKDKDKKGKTQAGLQTVPIAEAAPIELLKQMLAEKFLEIALQSHADADGISHKATWSMANQSGRGQTKKVIPINFCPITGFPLSDVVVTEVSDGSFSLR